MQSVSEIASLTGIEKVEEAKRVPSIKQEQPTKGVVDGLALTSVHAQGKQKVAAQANMYI